jgi:UrcA family protein
MKKLFAILVGCLVIGTATAQDQVVIDYSDVNLGTPAGADVLYGRIVNAAQRVCREAPLLDVHRYLMWQSCLRGAIATAVTNVDDPLLTARHQHEMPPRLYSSRAMAK